MPAESESELHAKGATLKTCAASGDAVETTILSWLHNHRRANTNQTRQVLSVPIRQPKAAVRFRAADVLRAGRAMNTVAWPVEPNPSGADWIVRALRNHQGPLQFACF